MIKETKEYIIKNNMIKQNDTVIAAVSGGADTMSMSLHLRTSQGWDLKRQQGY